VNGVNPGGQLTAVAYRRSLGLDRGHRTLTVVRLGDKIVTIPPVGDHA
jgi:hypothetical protein